jgi:hypothetical protein
VERISEIWFRVQRCLLYVEEHLPELTRQHKRIIGALEVVRIEDFVEPACWQWLGRRRKDRKALARAFVAKACLNLPTTEALIDRLKTDKNLRQICGWQTLGEIPSKSTFSRAYAKFALTSLGDAAHKACVEECLGDDVVWHVSRDSTEIDGREKPAAKPKKEPKPKYRCGRPKRGEERAKPGPTRIERQLTQTAAEAIAELPVICDVGTKIDSKGSKRHWVGYKLHVDVGDGGIPLAAVTTSASVHDSQVAIPLARMTAERAESLYDLMDTAYDAKLIRSFSQQLGHVAIIPQSARHGKVGPMEPDRARRYNNRTTAERFNSRLKDEFGGRMVRVRGKPKVHLHLMFGVLAIFAEALLGLAI